jgi:hypothetical protein
MRILAVDWSGARTGERRFIWAAEAAAGQVTLRGGLRRRGVEELIVSRATDQLVVGLDFAFSLPAWFLAERGLRTARELWELVAREGEEWLRDPRPPFWRRASAEALAGREPFRRTEGNGAKSVFQLVGAGQVGTGSLRGMPMLARLQDAGLRIWPFDPPEPPLVVEIYPRLLTGPLVRADRAARERRLADFPELAPDARAAAAASEDAFDAAVSAAVMARSFDAAELPPGDRLEGWIWRPPPRLDSHA